MFEPFYSSKVPAFGEFNYFQYMRPHEMNRALYDYCSRVFTGDIRDRWIDHQVEQLRPEIRIIKAIRANLFLRWIHSSFPEIPLIFVIRHPCAVVLSRMNLDWATDSDIEPFLSQADLVEDYLSDKLDIIRSAQSPVEKHAIIWCISNLVPIKQFLPGKLNMLFYEDLCLQPEVEIPRLFGAIQMPYGDSVLAKLDRPSTTSLRTSAVVTGQHKVEQWKKELSLTQIRKIYRIVRVFGLDDIYGEASTPAVTSSFMVQQ
jgi:hypothetical protein